MAGKPRWAQPWQRVSTSVAAGLLPAHRRRRAPDHRVHLFELHAQVSSSPKMLLDVATALAEEQLCFINPQKTLLAHKIRFQSLHSSTGTVFTFVLSAFWGITLKLCILIRKSVRSSQNSSLLFLFPVPTMPFLTGVT